MYDSIFRLSVALTNYHIGFYPLRDDARRYYQYQHRLLQIGADIREKRRRTQEKHRVKRKRRMESTLDDYGGEEDASEDSLTQLPSPYRLPSRHSSRTSL